jgi:uncharacterized membrane protein (DUF4010 family)
MLIENASQAWRMFSVQAMAVAAAIQVAWPALPDSVKAGLPPSVVTWVTCAVLVLGIIGRVIQQPLGSENKTPRA